MGNGLPFASQSAAQVNDMSAHETVDPKLFAQAMTWVCRMRKPGDDLEDPYTDPGVRQAAFADWLRASPRHVWAYFQATEYFKELRKYAPPISPVRAPAEFEPKLRQAAHPRPPISG